MTESSVVNLFLLAVEEIMKQRWVSRIGVRRWLECLQPCSPFFFLQ